MDRILVIDDDNPVAELIKEALTKMGFQVQTASGGHEGIRLFEKELFEGRLGRIVFELVK